MSNKSEYIECAKVINTHGCHGAVKLESWCNTPEELSRLKRVYINENGVYNELKIKKASVFKQFVIAELDGINDMDEAMTMKNTVLYADRADFKLKKGEYFIADLIGVSVIDAESGKVYGTLTEITNRGASDIYVVETPTGEKLLPAVDEFIVNVDIENGIYVKTIPGLLD